MAVTLLAFTGKSRSAEGRAYLAQRAAERPIPLFQAKTQPCEDISVAGPSSDCGLARTMHLLAATERAELGGGKGTSRRFAILRDKVDPRFRSKCLGLPSILEY